MGKWAEVECVCSNRRPVPGSDYFFDRPHRKKQRLTKREREEVEEWERTTYQMFECGHRRGVLIEFWPGEIINLGDSIGSIFKDQFAIFKRVGDWRSYDDELLLVQPDDAELWLMEIDEIRRALGGEGNLPSAKIEAVMLESFRQDLGTRLHLEQQLDDAAAKMPFARVNALRDNLAQTPRPELQSTIDKIYEAITDAAMLCQASIQTRNPIRLLW